MISVDVRFEGGFMDGMRVWYAVPPGPRVAYAPLPVELGAEVREAHARGIRVDAMELARLGPATAPRWPGAEVYEAVGIEPGADGAVVVYRLVEEP